MSGEFNETFVINDETNIEIFKIKILEKIKEQITKHMKEQKKNILRLYLKKKL
jgi:hypothetical protein